MTASDIVLLISMFAVLLVLARVERHMSALNIANKVALGLLIVFVGYYFSAPEIKKLIQESRASPDIGKSKTSLPQSPAKTPTKKLTQEQKTYQKEPRDKINESEQTSTLTETKKKSTIKNKEQQRMLEDFERKKSDIYERHEKFKKEAYKKLDEMTGDP